MRIMCHERFHVSSPNEILFGWTLNQLTEAHTVCDMLEELEVKMSKAHEARMKAGT